MTDPLNIMFDDFGIRLLSDMIEFSCLYILHKGIIVSVLYGYEVQMNIYLFCILSELPPLMGSCLGWYSCNASTHDILRW